MDFFFFLAFCVHFKYDGLGVLGFFQVRCFSGPLCFQHQIIIIQKSSKTALQNVKTEEYIIRVFLFKNVNVQKRFFYLTVVNVLCTGEIPGRNPTCTSPKKSSVAVP